MELLNDIGAGRVAGAGQQSLDQPLRLAADPWWVILAVGGACWLVVTLTALLWLAPMSGTVVEGQYVVTTAARALQHLMVFVVAALAYRLAIAMGWPSPLRVRVRVTLLNTLMGIAVVFFSPIALAIVAGYIDGRTVDMHETLEAWLPPGFGWEAWAAPLRFFLPPYVLGLCAIALVVVARRHHREAVRAAGLASAYSAARLAMLSAQLQPHFLFNSLHAISALIEDSPRQAGIMLARLGDFLRHALESSHWPWIDLASELAGLEAYLAVQQIRFSDRLSIAIDASPEALTIYVPSLLLQPLAENAIEHGRKESDPMLQVYVSAKVLGQRLYINVSNSSPRLERHLSPTDYGHGLSNVDLRLRAAYDGEARLTVGPNEHGGTSAILDLPLRTGWCAAEWREPRT